MSEFSGSNGLTSFGHRWVGGHPHRQRLLDRLWDMQDLEYNLPPLSSLWRSHFLAETTRALDMVPSSCHLTRNACYHAHVVLDLEPVLTMLGFCAWETINHNRRDRCSNPLF